jgi:GDSL-like lipase/acylhydrolase family protein
MQKRSFWATAAFTLVILLGLTAIAMVKPPRYRRATDTPLKRLWRTLSKDELNREARERNTVAYYEGLLNEGSRVSSMNTLVTGEQRFESDEWDGAGRRRRQDFRYWDLEPGYANRDPVEPRRDLAVNSLGMADIEYTVEKPADTWRIALLGDSITRGQGAPMFRNFETLLEERLNSTRAPGAPRIEILNFAVGGYRITQLVDAAVDWVPRFQPDVYVLPLSELSVFRRWADHLTTLVQGGVDLKYDYLKQMVQQAGLRADDASGTADAKLARFRLQTIDWAVRTVRARAASHNAKLVVVLLPNGTDPEVLAEEFAGVQGVLRETGVPVIDLLDIFENVDDPRAHRVSETNVHPNELGHRVLYLQLYERITQDAELTALFRGSPTQAR